MRLFILTVAAALFAVVMLAACNSSELVHGRTVQAPSPATQAAEDVPRITAADVKTELENKTAVLIDVRAESSYKSGHVKGAKLIPYNEIGQRSDELPKDKKIITYCT